MFKHFISSVLHFCPFAFEGLLDHVTYVLNIGGHTLSAGLGHCRFNGSTLISGFLFCTFRLRLNLVFNRFELFYRVVLFFLEFFLVVELCFLDHSFIYLGKHYVLLDRLVPLVPLWREAIVRIAQFSNLAICGIA